MARGRRIIEMFDRVYSSQCSCGAQSACSDSASRFCTYQFPSCGGTDTYNASGPSYGPNYQRALRRLQAVADAIPVRRYVPQQSLTPACSCGCHCGCGCHCSCGCQDCSCGCQNGCSCDCGSQSGDSCTQAQYFGHPTQEVAAGGSLIFSRYSPPEDADPAASLMLPCGKYLISYSVNASAAGAADSATLGSHRRSTGWAFPRGGSFATVPAGGSAALSSSFIVSLSNAANTVSFYNTGALSTTYQLLNISVIRVC